jgi:hypothetical protein
VTEKADPRARLFDFSGNLVAEVDGGAFNPFCRNMDIAVDGSGRVLVTDTVKLQVLVFEPARGGFPS